MKRHKSVGLLGLSFGIAALLISLVLSPSLVKILFTPDGELSQITIFRIQTARFAIAIMSIIISIFSLCLYNSAALYSRLGQTGAYMRRHFSITASIIIMALYVIYCIAFIWNASFTIEGTRFFTLFDDAMISMRYAKNLANGHGLVWNPGGQPVEGYSNFLWVIYMAFWHLFPISLAKIALPIKATSLGFLVGSLYSTKRITRKLTQNTSYAPIGAMILFASYLPITFWSLRGMATSVLIFVVLFVTWRILIALEKQSFDPLIPIVLGIGLLIRTDFLVLFVGLTVFPILAIPNKRLKYLGSSIAIFLTIVIGHTLFRQLYYGEILPNTYYLKMTGLPVTWRILKGLQQLKAFVNNMSIIVFTLPLIYAFLRYRFKPLILLSGILLLQLAYSAYVGGDAWEWWGHLANRYITVVMPAFFILLAITLDHIAEIMQRYGATIRANMKAAIFSLLLLMSVYQLYDSPVLLDFINATGLDTDNDEANVRLALDIKDITTKEAKIAVLWAGAIPYFSERHAIDLYGYNDKYIARQEANINSWRDFWPGHNKTDYDYAIGKRKPDVIVRLRKGPAKPYLDEYTTTVINHRKIYLRKQSEHIKWSEL